MNFSTSRGSLKPLSFSTPLATSTAEGVTSHIAVVIFEILSPPARIKGLSGFLDLNFLWKKWLIF